MYTIIIQSVVGLSRGQRVDHMLYGDDDESRIIHYYYYYYYIYICVCPCDPTRIYFIHIIYMRVQCII